MTFPTRRSTTLATTLGLAASSLLLASSPASAATSCLGSTCNGLDPATTVCQNDARTVLWAGWNEVELRYSPTCRAAWARKTTGVPGRGISVTNSLGNSYSTVWNGGTAYTRMVNDKDIKAWACAHWDAGEQHECTAGY
ncbi:DUF2690 domain-containing protein [Streptomyces sp. NPDC047718]|uniref:DUF2690 domain-containing protein n=1 Tax=Streptomyces sp. NPDC047718 TaxID=3155479 RepID=UPI0033F5B0F0